MRLGHSREAGFTFAELAFGMLILVISAAVLINHLAVNYQTTNTERDRVFAFSKAQAMLAEIQSYVDRGELEAVDLDVLDDGIVNKTTLSIQESSPGTLILPDHVVSGNMQRDSQWIWSRRITVQPFAGINNRNVRYVTVRIYKRDRAGTEWPLADLSAVVNSSGDAFPATQVLDVYLLAIENIPGWWVFMDSIKPFIESMITDLEVRNPGLEFRSHWITKASFGRNQTYRPYTNDVADSNAVIPDVYHYPGRMPTGSASAYYYVPDNMRGRINVEGTERNGYDGILNPHPYALADFFNHAMRYPDELALWQQRVAAVEAKELEIATEIAAGNPPPAELTDMSKEPTYRLFLEDLYSSPDKYKNALVINLHGELLPMPALRNYSDPAKSPATHPELRVVTHPEELRTKHNDAGVTHPLRMRMYAFGYHTATTPWPPVGGEVMNRPMVVEIVGTNLVRPSPNETELKPGVTLQRLGGYGAAVPYTGWGNAPHVSTAVGSEMQYSAEYVDNGTEPPFTRIYLFNTPTVCTRDPVSGQGLANSMQARLYQMEYVPSPVQLDTSVTPIRFGRDLTNNSATQPKNTARWTLELDTALLTDGVSFVDDLGAAYLPADLCLKIRTRIAHDYGAVTPTWKTDGTTWPLQNPDNLSTTYAWWTDSKEDVPFTERSQFNGDPRHVPYKDCFNVTGEDFPNSYNWYHDDLANNGQATLAADYPVITAGLLRDHWGGGAMACDVPRYFQLLREGLVKSRCVYTTLTGWSYYYLGIGNDIGYDSANGYPSSIPSHLGPHGSATTGYIQTIIGARRLVRRAGAGYWWGIPWLGELAPDRTAGLATQGQWLDVAGGTPRGNLTPGTSTDQYFQSNARSVYAGSDRIAWGTYMYDSMQRTSTYGCTTFFNIGTAASTFQHSSSTANGTLTAIGNELANNYNMSVPASAPVSRPFRINVATAVAEHFNSSPYGGVGERFSATTYKTYYSHASGAGSSVIKLVNPGNTDAAYVVVNGISNAVDNGSTFIAKYSLLTLVHTMFEAGSTSNTHRIQQQPRMEITSPTDITEIDNPMGDIPVQYGVSWTRWDGLPYSATGSFAEAENQLEYVLMYSNDGGASWLYLQDNTPATPAVRPTDSTYIVADAGAGTETYDWDVGAFPEGTYLLRIDCYRQGAQVHYSYHKTRLFIQR